MSKASTQGTYINIDTMSKAYGRGPMVYNDIMPKASGHDLYIYYHGVVRFLDMNKSF